MDHQEQSDFLSFLRRNAQREQFDAGAVEIIALWVSFRDQLIDAGFSREFAEQALVNLIAAGARQK